jgi:hypothetical protein
VTACGGGGGDGSATENAQSRDTAPGQVAKADPAPAPAPAPADPAPADPAPQTAQASAATVSAAFTSMTAVIPNPERGIDSWGPNLHSTTLSTLQTYYNQGKRVLVSRTNIGAYRTTAFPQSYLDQLTAGFAAYRQAGMKVGLTFMYTDQQDGLDATTSMIQTHLAQLKPILAANADVIAYMHAGFIGAWGEWGFSSSNGSPPSDSSRAAVRDALLANVPSSIIVQFRQPDVVRSWYPTPLTAAQAFNGSAQARVGLHNDCWFGSIYDVGTYNPDPTGLRAYAQQLSQFTPWGGETCGSLTTQGTRSPLVEGPQYHLSNLRDDWGPVMQWDAATMTTLKTYMGYRFQLDDISHVGAASAGSTVTMNVNVRNVGWARIFSARKLVVTLVNKSTGATIKGTGSTDLRTLAPQATSSTLVPVSVTIPSTAAKGEYDVMLSMPDVYATTGNDVRYSVRFANADNAGLNQAWNASSGRFKVGTTFTVQ